MLLIIPIAVASFFFKEISWFDGRTQAQIFALS